MNFNRKDIIVLLISILLFLITLIVVLVTDYSIGLKHYVGFFALLLSVFLYFKNKEIYRYIFVITLLAGLVGLLNFFCIVFEIDFNIIKINPLFFLLLILFFALENYNNLTLKSTNERDPDLKIIQLYKKKYKVKSEEELIEIADEKSKYVNEAKIASREILQEKYNRS